MNQPIERFFFHLHLWFGTAVTCHNHRLFDFCPTLFCIEEKITFVEKLFEFTVSQNIMSKIKFDIDRFLKNNGPIIYKKKTFMFGSHKWEK